MMKKLFYIDYPQEHFEDQLHRYRCAYCKIETTVINGKLEGHLATCPYRVKLSAAGFQASNKAASVDVVGHDADDFD
jgi:hypothetical protein